MTEPQTVSSTLMQAPLGGLNLRDPLVDMEPIYSPWMVNWDPEQHSVNTRKPYKIHAAPIAAPGWIKGLGAWNAGTPKLFAFLEDGADGKNEIWDVTGTPHKDVDLSAGVADECYPAYYNGRLTLATEVTAETYYYNNSGTWTQMASTDAFTNGGSPISGRIYVQYKGRVYIFYSQTMYYSDTIGAVAGTCSSYNLASYIQGPGYVWWGGVLSSPGDRPSEVYLAFGTDDGEVFVYGGDYPGSSSWAMVGRYKVSPLLGYNSILVYHNDIWILTRTGIVSLRDLMTKGAIAAEELTVSSLIDPYWTKLLNNESVLQRSRVSAAFWPEENKVYILAGGFLSISNEVETFDSSEGTMFVYNCITQAWTIHELAGVTGLHLGGLTYYQNNLYFFTGTGEGSVTSKIMKVNTAATGVGTYQDEDYLTTGATLYTAIQLPLDSAPMPTGKKTQIHGFEPAVYAQDVGTRLYMYAVADFGRQASAGAKVTLPAGYSIPHYGCGAIGQYVQYRFGGNPYTARTAPGGIKLFSVGALLS